METRWKSGLLTSTEIALHGPRWQDLSLFEYSSKVQEPAKLSSHGWKRFSPFQIVAGSET
jgi:hypothetical protein